jgi:hypothetical protein
VDEGRTVCRNVKISSVGSKGTAISTALQGKSNEFVEADFTKNGRKKL